MDKQPRQFEHVFYHKRHKVSLICSIEMVWGERSLILEDVLASKQHIADGVPDWRIEAEACDAASYRRAKYM